MIADFTTHNTFYFHYDKDITSTWCYSHDWSYSIIKPVKSNFWKTLHKVMGLFWPKLVFNLLTVENSIKICNRKILFSLSGWLTTIGKKKKGRNIKK